MEPGDDVLPADCLEVPILVRLSPVSGGALLAKAHTRSMFPRSFELTAKFPVAQRLAWHVVLLL